MNWAHGILKNLGGCVSIDFNEFNALFGDNQAMRYFFATIFNIVERSSD